MENKGDKPDDYSSLFYEFLGTAILAAAI